MDVIIALIFFSLTLVVAGLVFFFSRLSDGDFEHGERLSLLPLEDDDGMGPASRQSADDKAGNPQLNRTQQADAGETPGDGRRDTGDADPPRG